MTTVLYSSSSAGPASVFISEGSYIVGVTARGNDIGVTYWEPCGTAGSSGMVTVELLVVNDHYVLSGNNYSMLEKLTPNRLRYLGHATIDNGERTHHVFEIQSAIYSECDGTVR